VPQKFHLKSATYGAAEIFSQIPLCPPFSKGDSLGGVQNLSLEKHALSAVEGRGKGDFWWNGVADLYGEFLGSVH
jgi:hypothetical protein